MSHIEIVKTETYRSTDKVNQGDDMVRVTLAMPRWHWKELQQELKRPTLNTEPPEEPTWIVNDLGELGVKVGDRFFFLYKGDNLEYTDGKHDNGDQMLYRIVGKREFGEVCHPIDYYDCGFYRQERYKRELTFYPGLSVGDPEDGDWRPIPPASEGRE